VSKLYVARQSGSVMLAGPDGRPRRSPIRRGVTVAEEGSVMMAKHGKLFEPLRVHHPAPAGRGSRAPVEQATAAPGELREVATPVAETHACDHPSCDATAKSPAGLASHKRRAHPPAAAEE
jgi:hypothetical protein